MEEKMIGILIVKFIFANRDNLITSAFILFIFMTLLGIILELLFYRNSIILSSIVSVLEIWLN